jgi:hypothetical protein
MLRQAKARAALAGIPLTELFRRWVERGLNSVDDGVETPAEPRAGLAATVSVAGP